MVKEEFLNIFKEKDYLLPQPFRENAKAYIENKDFPTLKDESWKHTNISNLLSHEFKDIKPGLFTSEILNSRLINDLEAFRIVMINDKISPELSFLPGTNLIIKPMAKAIVEDKELVLKHIDSKKFGFDNLFAAINTSYSVDGYFISLADSTKLDKPLNIIHLIDDTQSDCISNPRNLLFIGNDCNLKIIEQYYSFSGFLNAQNDNFDFQPTNSYYSLNNIVSEIVVGPQSTLEYNLIQEESLKAYQINTLRVIQEEGSRFTSNTITLSGRLVRNETRIYLNGQYCETTLNGLSLPAMEEHFDNYVFVNHANPGCKSNQLYKGIVNNKAANVFLGRVYVAKGAQKTDATQSNKNILLTNEAKVRSKPQLEIYADDVKCSHGSTTGQLDKEQLFYLQTRGISKENGRILLLQAFAAEVVNKLSIEPLKNYVMKLIEKII